MKSAPVISHLGIAVREIDEACARWERLLGHPADHREQVADQQVAVAMFAGKTVSGLQQSDGRIELVAPTSENSPIAKFLAAKGEGLHHICIYCDDISAKLAELKAAGFRLIDEVPRVGAQEKKIAFVHPASTGGVLIELEERS